MLCFLLVRFRDGSFLGHGVVFILRNAPKVGWRDFRKPERFRGVATNGSLGGDDVEPVTDRDPREGANGIRGKAVGAQLRSGRDSWQPYGNQGGMTGIW